MSDEKIVLTQAQRKVLAELAKFNIPTGPGVLGKKVWGKPRVPPQGYAMTCGKVLNALEKLGLAYWDPGIFEDAMTGWVITRRGERFLKEQA
jgi:hypothetical protein